MEGRLLSDKNPFIQLISSTLEFLVDSNLFIALAALCYTWQSYLLLGLPVRLDALPVLVFFASLLIYNLHRLISLPVQPESNISNIHQWMKDHYYLLLVILGICVVAIVVSFVFLKRTTQATLVLLGLTSVIYAFPVRLSKNFKIRLRDFGVLKPFIVGAVWAFVTVFLPEVNNGLAWFELKNVLIFLKAFFFISALTIPFDVRDMDYDRKSLRYGTIAMLIGWKKSLRIGFAVLVFFFGIAIYLSTVFMANWWLLAAYFASFVLTAILIFRTSPKRSEYYYTFRIDSMIILQFVLVGAAYLLR